ncbi:MAG TPA: DUF1501 domain-containing protein, partial [Gemmatales bacterium]|nr:DUF1501 domain-containing protein [Gemmatales bacterium]
MFSQLLQRRSFLQHSAYGLGALALGELLGWNVPSRAEDDKPRGVLKELHHRPRAKRIIHLCMAGGPSQHESFDFKPKLQELHGKPFPASFTQGQQLAQLQNTKLIARGSFASFARHGQSGQEISDLFPHLA